MLDLNNDLVMFACVVLFIVVVCYLLGTRYYDRKLNKGGDISSKFSPDRWRFTADTLGMREPYPHVDFQKGENKGDYVITLTPTKGSSVTQYTKFEEQFRSLLDCEFALVEQKGNSVTYKLFKEQPDLSGELKNPQLWTPEVLGETGKPVLSKLPIGVKRDGSTFYYNPLAHVALIGASGAGKGSVLWSIIGALAPLPETEIWGVDLKSGVEFGMGEELFAQVAYNSDELIELMSRLEEKTNSRLTAMRKAKIRDWKYDPSNPEEKYIFLFIDEVNSINDSMESKPKKERDAFNTSFKEVLRKSRAAGIYMFIAGQDPRSSALPARNLFQQRIALRANSQLDQQILLGDESIRYGQTWLYAKSSKGNPGDAGRGLMFDDESKEYVEFRAFYPSDEEIVKWRKA